MRILVVEDEASLAKQLTSSIAQAGYAVDHAADGERADLLAHTEQYDAMVLDLGLPKIDGLALLRNWRVAGVATPVLVLTARGSWHEKVRGIDGGADDYMSKPFRIEEVLARLRALMRRAHDREKLAGRHLEVDTVQGDNPLPREGVDVLVPEVADDDLRRHAGRRRAPLRAPASGRRRAAGGSSSPSR